MRKLIIILFAVVAANAEGGTRELFRCARSLAEEPPRAGTTELGLAVRGPLVRGMDQIVIFREREILSFQVSPRELVAQASGAPAGSPPRIELRTEAYHLRGMPAGAPGYLDFDVSIASGVPGFRVNYENIRFRRHLNGENASVRNLYAKAQVVNFGQAGGQEVQGQKSATDPMVIRLAERAVLARARTLVGIRNICTHVKACADENNEDLRRLQGCIDALGTEHPRVAQTMSKYLEAMRSDMREELESGQTQREQATPQGPANAPGR